MAPVVLELQRRGAFRVITCLTGQHREMLDQVVDEFSLSVDYDLKIMRERQTLGHITSAVLNGLDPILEASKPDIVLVHGDTTTTFAAALAAYYRMIPVAHVEAGLRTDTIYNPYPEEINRRLVDRLAEVYYAPTVAARDALLHEGRARSSILVTGNTVIDALLVTAASDPPAWEPKLEKALKRPGPKVLVTVHRRENWGAPMEQVAQAIKRVGEEHPVGHLHLPHPPQPGGAHDLPRRARRRQAGGVRRTAGVPPVRPPHEVGRRGHLRLGRSAGRGSHLGQAGAGHAQDD